MTSYIGKIVFLECKGPSSYLNGEYVIVEQSPNNLYGLKPEAGYGGHDIKTLPLVGKDAYEVIRVTDDKPFLSRLAKSMREFSNTRPGPDGKRHWIDSVYTSAARNADKLEAMANCHCPTDAAQVQSFVAGAHRITVTIEPA